MNDTEMGEQWDTFLEIVEMASTRPLNMVVRRTNLHFQNKDRTMGVTQGDLCRITHVDQIAKHRETIDYTCRYAGQHKSEVQQRLLLTDVVGFRPVINTVEPTPAKLEDRAR